MWRGGSETSLGLALKNMWINWLCLSWVQNYRGFNTEAFILTSSVTLGKALGLLQPQFSHFYKPYRTTSLEVLLNQVHLPDVLQAKMLRHWGLQLREGLFTRQSSEEMGEFVSNLNPTSKGEGLGIFMG